MYGIAVDVSCSMAEAEEKTSEDIVRKIFDEIEVP